MDKYSLSARVYPMIIVLLPIVILGIAYSFEYEKIQQTLSALGITAALTYFLSNIGRDQGKKKEGALWESWGGAPTSQLFSFSNDVLDTLTKERYHVRMDELSESKSDLDYKNSTLEELGDTYKSWTKILITKTRDTSVYPLIFKELVSYGFRRNLWGLKPFGVIVTIMCSAGSSIFQIVKYGHENLFEYTTSFYVSELALIALLFVWVFVINAGWVRIPAFGYAERLLEAVDSFNVSEDG